MLTIEVNDRTLAYLRAGEAAAQSICFIHGFTCDHSDWSRQIANFQSDYDVIAIDLAGHGSSDEPDDGFSVSGFASDVAAILDALHVKDCIVVGHSMGCRVTLELASMRTDLTKKMVLIDSGRMAVAEGFDERLEAMLVPFADKTFDIAMSGMFSEMFFDARYDDLKQCTVERAVNFGGKKSRELGSAIMHWDAFEMPKRIGEVSIPMLVIPSNGMNAEGRRTPLTQEDYAAEFALFANASDHVQLQILENTGHFSMWERPSDINRLISEFIRD